MVRVLDIQELSAEEGADMPRVLVPRQTRASGAGDVYIDRLATIYEPTPSSGNPWFALFIRLTSTGAGMWTIQDGGFRAVVEYTDETEETPIEYAADQSGLTGRIIIPSRNAFGVGNAAGSRWHMWSRDGQRYQRFIALEAYGNPLPRTAYDPPVANDNRVTRAAMQNITNGKTLSKVHFDFDQ